MKKLFYSALLILISFQLIAQDGNVEIGQGKPWDVISLSVGAAAGWVVSAIGKNVVALINALFTRWISGIRRQSDSGETSA